MKKLFTMLFSFGIMTSVFAQLHDRDRHEDLKKSNTRTEQYRTHDIKNSNDVAGTNEHRNVNTYEMSREHDMQLQRINNEYDKRIMAVRNNRRVRAFGKQRQIKMLEAERAAQIRKVNMDVSKSYDKNDNRYTKAGNKRW